MSTLQEWECWQSSEGLLLTASGRQDLDALIGSDRKLLYRFDAPDYDSAMSEHYRRQGWGPYGPMEE